MKIKYLGTAAAEAIPGVFCECDICKRSREAGGKNIRTRSQALIDDKLLIDFPADTYFHSIVHGIELSKIKTCLITHNHSDHLYPGELWCRSESIAYFDNMEPFTMYAAKSGYNAIKEMTDKHNLEQTNRVIPKEIKPYEPFEAEGYKITALKANHDEKSTPVIYLIEKDDKHMLYAHDTGFFVDETVEYLKKTGVKLDFASFDCCGCLIQDEDYGLYGHMNLVGDIKMRKLLEKNGNITKDTICVINHFSHNGTPLHEEILPSADENNFIVSYDGLEIEF